MNINKLNLHSQFDTLLKNKVNPTIILEFIYKNVYELINEIPFLSDSLGEDLKKNYHTYFFSVIEKSEENYLLTLFPNPELCKYFSFKKMYIGITGRLVFFSEKNRVYYWYGDPRAWNISYNIIKEEDGKYKYDKCMFFFFEDYKSDKFIDCPYFEYRPDTFLIITKNNLSQHTLTNFLASLINYKLNLENTFNKDIYSWLSNIYIKKKKHNSYFKTLSYYIKNEPNN